MPAACVQPHGQLLRMASLTSGHERCSRLLRVVEVNWSQAFATRLVLMLLRTASTDTHPAHWAEPRKDEAHSPKAKAKEGQTAMASRSRGLECQDEECSPPQPRNESARSPRDGCLPKGPAAPASPPWRCHIPHHESVNQSKTSPTSSSAHASGRPDPSQCCTPSCDGIVSLFWLTRCKPATTVSPDPGNVSSVQVAAFAFMKPNEHL